MRTIVIACFALFLAACQNAPEAFRPRPFAFEVNRSAPTSINVAEIKIIENYQPPLRQPFVEQDFPVAPANAVRKWVDSRLKATGASGVLEVTIDDASVRETRLPKTKGVKGVFTDDQEARYDAKLSVTFRLFRGERAISEASGEVIVTRSRTINEHATVDQRDAMYHQMTAEMMNDFEREANSRLRQYFR